MEPGFRFFPTEEELVSFYLYKKLEHQQLEMDRVIPVLDIYKLEPWQLPRHCGELCHGDKEQWFFFVPMNEKEVHGGRPSRTTASGYWKATGSLSYVHSSGGEVIGVKKSMVFYQGKAGSGRKTKWKMNEYKAIKPISHTLTPKLRREMSLCRIYVVSGSCRAFDRRPTLWSGRMIMNIEENEEWSREDDQVHAEEGSRKRVGKLLSDKLLEKWHNMEDSSEGRLSTEMICGLETFFELDGERDPH